MSNSYEYESDSESESEETKLYTITWSSSKEQIVFGPEVEKQVVKLTLQWILQTKKIDLDTVRKNITIRKKIIYDFYDDVYKLDDAKLIQLLLSQCNSTDHLHYICKYSNLYYHNDHYFNLFFHNPLHIAWATRQTFL